MKTAFYVETTSQLPAGNRLRAAITSAGLVPLVGVYDVFSATLAAQHFEGIFVSGFGFGASHYGLPDLGFNSWSDIVAFVQRIRTVLPAHHIVVDIDDGFGDVGVACHVVSLLEAAGASGIVLEDQARPRRCGHLGGKRILPLADVLAKLNRVLQTRRSLFVVARTDASDRLEILERVAPIPKPAPTRFWWTASAMGICSVRFVLPPTSHWPLIRLPAVLRRREASRNCEAQGFRSRFTAPLACSQHRGRSRTRCSG